MIALHIYFSGIDALIEFIQAGGRLPNPPLCPSEIYNMMENCWNFDPMKRPTFKQLKACLDDPKTVQDVSKFPMNNQ